MKTEMKTADFLFPQDLKIPGKEISRILLIGSCLSEFYVTEFGKFRPDLAMEHIFFNMTLPPKSHEELAKFDLQYIQLPLRFVLTDGVLRRPRDNGHEPDWLEIGKSNIDAMLAGALGYCSSGILTLVSNFVVPQGRIVPSLGDYDTEFDITSIIRDLNTYLSLSIKKYSNVYLADIDMIANTLGKRYFLDDTVFFFTHGVALSLDQFLSHEEEYSLPARSRIDGALEQVQYYEAKLDEFYQAVYHQIDSIYRTVNQVDSIKLVIFDLDNTLWRGQIGEHYEPGTAWPRLDNWPLGIWDAINQLRRRGIVVSICSKNDEETVKKKWRHGIQLPLVEYEDFLVPKINWLPKSQNIAEIMRELSLTPKNVLFVDDNPVERDSVKAAFPEIRVIGADPFAVKRILLWSAQTQVAKLSTESASREKSLASIVQRDKERVAMSRDEFLLSLQAEVELVELKSADDPDFYRVSELVNKTNQFNTTGVRRTPQDYLSHWNNGGRVFAFSVTDKYSDYGLVGVLFEMVGCITQYVMSCRVFGMEIETAVLRKIAEKLRSEDPARVLLGIILHTDKNTPSRSVFTAAGYQATDNPQLFMSIHPISPDLSSHVRTYWRGEAVNSAADQPSDYDFEKKEHDKPVIDEEIRIAFIGNSLTHVDTVQDIGWHHSHGMAAPNKAADYVHLLLEKLGLPESCAYIRNFYPFENDATVQQTHVESLTEVFAKKPWSIVIQLGDNAGSEAEQLSTFSENLKLLVATASKSSEHVFCVSSWWRAPLKDALIENISKEYGATYIFIGDIYADPENPDRRSKDFEHTGVDMHPKAWGMEQISNRLLSALQLALERTA